MGLGGWIMDLLYPPRCVLCHCFLEHPDRELCPDCRKLLEQEVRHLKRPRHSASVTAVLYYEEHVRSSLLRYKFGRRVCYAPVYGRWLADRLRQDQIPFDLITWVPVSAKRLWQRGYDQAKLLARATAKALGMGYVRTLIKHRDVPAQSTIQEESQRRANVLGVYRIHPKGEVRGKSVLLIDDILTSGATLAEAIRVLLEAGAKEVHVAVIAAKRSSR